MALLQLKGTLSPALSSMTDRQARQGSSGKIAQAQRDVLTILDPPSRVAHGNVPSPFDDHHCMSVVSPASVQSSRASHAVRRLLLVAATS